MHPRLQGSLHPPNLGAVIPHPAHAPTIADIGEERE
jgi:hypothetical protein